MENLSENSGQSQKTSFKNWFSNKYNLAFLGILIFAVIIRIYYFVLTKNQPLWWDEADYLAYAKNLAGLGGDWIITAQHNSLYPFLAAGLFFLGFGEPFVKFFLQVIPSVLSVWLVYLISNEMYKDKRISLIAGFLMAVFWVVLFNSMRFHIDIPALFFGLLAIYVFFRGYENKKKIFGRINSNWAIPLAILFVILAYAVRRGYFLFGIFIFIYVLLATKDWKKLITDKYNWIGLVAGIILFLLAEKFLFYSGISEVGQTYFHPKISFAPFGVFKAFFSFGSVLKDVSLYLFILGALIAIFTLVFSYGYIREDKSRKLKGNLFVLITIFLTLLALNFVLISDSGVGPSYGEERWYLPLAFGAFIAVSQGLLLIFDFIKKYSRFFAVFLIVLLLGLVAYFQIQQSDAIIKDKIPSFGGIRDASIYMKEISSPEGIIISQPVPQTIYYSGKKVLQPEQIANVTGSGYSLGEFLNGLKDYPNAKYLLISFSEPGYPEWMKQQTSSSWEIPFMQTKIDFSSGKQDIKPALAYGNITFSLVNIKQDVFIYEINR